MQFRKITRPDRWVGFFLSILIGSVFSLVFWLADFLIFSALVFIFMAALGLYMLLASEESMERIGKMAWLFL
jgi:hypothetical protein